MSAENLAARDQLELREGEIRDMSAWALSLGDWTVTDENGARDAFGGPVPTIADLQVVDYATSLDEGSSAVRVRQRLQTGEVVELILVPDSQLLLPADVAAAEAGDFIVRDEIVGTDDVNVVVAERGELRIVLRGAVDTGVLRGLVGAVSGFQLMITQAIRDNTGRRRRGVDEVVPDSSSQAASLRPALCREDFLDAGVVGIRPELKQPVT